MMAWSDEQLAEYPADPLAALRHAVGDYELDEDALDEIPTPTHWPRIPAVDVVERWRELRAWVEQLQERFSHLDHHVIPRCWWRHNEHVEALCALRDHERCSFSSMAPATAPIDWFRALRDVTALLKAWTGELGCSATHQDPSAAPGGPNEEEWQRFVQADAERREQREAVLADTE